MLEAQLEECLLPTPDLRGSNPINYSEHQPTNQLFLEKTKIDEKEAEKSPSLKVPVTKFQITIFKYFFSMPFLMIAFYIPSRDTSPRGKWTIY